MEQLMNSYTCKTGADFEQAVLILLNGCKINAQATKKEDKGVDIIATYLYKEARTNPQHPLQCSTALGEGPYKLLLYNTRRLKDTCGEIISRYDETSQQIFYELWDSKGQKITPKIVKHIKKCCPVPSFSADDLAAAWEDATMTAKATKRKSISFSFELAQIEPIIRKLGGEQQLQALFWEFLKERAR